MLQIFKICCRLPIISLNTDPCLFHAMIPVLEIFVLSICDMPLQMHELVVAADMAPQFICTVAKDFNL